MSTPPETVKRDTLLAFIGLALRYEKELVKVQCGFEAHLLETARAAAEQTLQEASGVETERY